MEWYILGKVSKEIESSDGSLHSYEILTDQGQTLVSKGTHVHHSEMAETENKEQSLLGSLLGWVISPGKAVCIKQPVKKDHSTSSRKVPVIFKSILFHCTLFITTFLLSPYLKLFLRKFANSLKELIVRLTLIDNLLFHRGQIRVLPGGGVVRVRVLTRKE